MRTPIPSVRINPIVDAVKELLTELRDELTRVVAEAASRAAFSAVERLIGRQLKEELERPRQANVAEPEPTHSTTTVAWLTAIGSLAKIVGWAWQPKTVLSAVAVGTTVVLTTVSLGTTVLGAGSRRVLTQLRNLRSRWSRA
jgi:hypothetical protein